MSRWIRFLIAILIGLALGLIYGWLINPVEYVDTSPATLRIDYKTDYILMIAESFQKEGDLALVAYRLALLGDTPPYEMVNQAILFAKKAGYSETDITLMQALMDSLQAIDLGQGTHFP
jgi:hypothetical protein